jgi:hypothetical protein
MSMYHGHKLLGLIYDDCELAQDRTNEDLLDQTQYHGIVKTVE